MAEQDALIPYPHNQEIVLRHKDSALVYDPASKQLAVRNAPAEHKLDLKDCPMCRRPLRETHTEEQPPERAEAAGPTTAAFASPEYFRLLHHSLPPSEQSSRATSPRRRLLHLRSGGAETPERTPLSSEYVGSSPVPTPHGISAAAFTPNYFSRFFVEERELGRGGKGVVLLVNHILDGVSLGHFALKRIPVGDDHKWLEKVLVEVQLLQHLSHQNLISYRHVWLEDVQINTFGPSVPCAFILQQYCNMGDLHDYVLQGMKVKTTKEILKQRMRRRSKTGQEQADGLRPRRLQFEEIRSFFKDITEGLNHLHANNYVHRDLKPSNCLLHDDGKGIRVLVSDFGEVQSENQIRNSTGATGTISYCAPEVLRHNPVTGMLGNFTTKSDIFSLGMILYFLCFAKLPYRNADVLDEDQEDVDLLKEEIRDWAGLNEALEFYPELPDKISRFLQRLLALDPASRPTAEETLHGIKTGSALDNVAEGRANPGTQPYAAPRRVSRISPIDSPRDNTPVRRSSRTMSRGGRSEPPGPLPAVALHGRLQKGMETDSTSESEGDELSPSTSMVLHSGTTSPVKQEPPPLPIEARHMLPHSGHVDPLRAVKLTGLVLKIISIYLSCHPVASKPIVSLPLLALGTLDLLVDHGYLSSLALLLAHVSIMIGALYNNMLCLPKASMWDEL